MEIWKWIPSNEGKYSISTFGNVYCATTKTLIRKSHYPRGYVGTKSVKINGKREFTIHRIMAITFLGSPPTPAHEVNHKNGVKGDNRVGNLEWVTRRENVRHAISTGLFTPYRSNKQNYKIPSLLFRRSDGKPRRSKQITQLKDGKVITVFVSAREAERQTGFFQTAISRCARGKLKSAYGYTWAYL